MEIKYIVIQAGGKGSRLKHLTANKPKGIVPVNNLPMIFHLMKKFNEKKFIIIADYKHEVIEKYCEVFSPADYFIINAKEKGTCAGIKQALDIIPQEEPFMIIWSDLVVGSKFELPTLYENMIGISENFQCRWSYKNDTLIEEPSIENGVAGCFIFKNKSFLGDIPTCGEFVRFLQEKKLDFIPFKLHDVNEVGTLIAYDSQKTESICRPFNSIEMVEDKVIKKAILPQGERLAKFEINWYKKISELKYKNIPKIYSYNPLIMENVKGKNIFKLDLTINEKKTVIANVVNSLKDLHSLGNCEKDYFSIQENYYKKTIERISKVRDLIPFANDREIIINGKRCKNIFFYKDEFKKLIEDNLYDTNFTIIHGDCTFSNMLVDNNFCVTLIDPRGYFGDLILYGDEYYDWAKLYYSINGNYDQFNNKNFVLDILENEIKLKINSSGYEELTDYFLSLIPNCDSKKIEILQAIIWLSLTTYAWEDYDSICGAFYNGLLYLNKYL